MYRTRSRVCHRVPRSALPALQPAHAGEREPGPLRVLHLAFNIARDPAKYLRSKALRKTRRRWTVSPFAGSGEEFDLFAATADPKALEPWEITAEREQTTC